MDVGLKKNQLISIRTALKAKQDWLPGRTDSSHANEPDKLSICEDSVNSLNMDSWCSASRNEVITEIPFTTDVLFYD